MERERRVILIHDPSSLNTSNSENKEPAGIAKYLTTFRDPVVLIISDIAGKDDCYHEIEQVIPKPYRQW
jgi:hypothetical protein